MPRHQSDKPLTQAERMEIFLAMVQAQDERMTVLQARKVVAGRFGVSACGSLVFGVVFGKGGGA